MSVVYDGTLRLGNADAKGGSILSLYGNLTMIDQNSTYVPVNFPATMSSFSPNISAGTTTNAYSNPTYNLLSPASSFNTTTASVVDDIVSYS